MDDFTQWRDVLPGLNRPPTLRQQYLDRAATRGMDHDEATHCLAAFRHSFPEMNEHDVCRWLIDEWRD